MAAMNEVSPPGPRETDPTACVLAGWPAAASAMAGARQSADDLCVILKLARAMAEAGRRVDLDGVEALVGRLCARSLDLMPDDGRQIALQLELVMAGIDALHHALAHNRAATALR